MFMHGSMQNRFPPEVQCFIDVPWSIEYLPVNSNASSAAIFEAKLSAAINVMGLKNTTFSARVLGSKTAQYELD